MRTLNRPMFRYGGPIKEGVMNGIREPKRNGGSMMGNNEGPRRAALVGNDVFPRTGGRENHFLQIPVGIGMGLAAAGRAAMRFAPQIARGAKRIFGPTTTKPAPFSPIRTKITGGYNEYGPANYTRKIIKDTASKSGGVRGAENVGKLGGTEVFTPNILGRDPIIRAGGKIISAITNPAVTGKLAGAARLVFSPSGAVIGGLYYANGKFFNKKGEEAPPPPEGSTLGDTVDIKGGGADTEAVRRSPEEIKAAEAKARMEKMESYKEIMDIKGMSKDAAYKSLIDASQIIADNGNLKEGIKDGSLIARLTGAASKRFDKVSDTETALRSLVAKGEIENEMNKEAKALARRKDELAIKTYEKSLSGDSFDEAILKSLTGTGGKMPTGNKLAGLLKATRGIDAVVLDGSQISKPGSEIAFIENQVIEGKKKGNPIPQGAYVINSTIVVIDEQGNVKKYY